MLRKFLVVLVVGLFGALVAPSAASAATCDDYSNQADAQRAADTRDADGDGIYCESLPCPCLTGGGGGGGESDDSADRRADNRRAADRRRRAARRRAAVRRARERRERLARQSLERGQWRVSDVADGDTFKVRRTDGSRTETVRAIGIDTPETRDPDVPVECGGPEATAAALFLTFSAPQDASGDGILDRKGGLGALVELQTDRSQDVRDAFGRALAYIDVVDDIPPAAGAEGYDIGKLMITAGWSPVYVFDKRFARHGQYTQAQSQAKSANRGSWAACGGDFHSEGG